jgi:hypothetical protein
MSEVLDHFRRQADACRTFGSRFTGELLDSAADDLAAGGVVASLLGAWPGKPQADAVSLRLAGALHAAVLQVRDQELARTYPASDSDWSMDRVWPAARSFLERNESWVRNFLKSPPQTNETGRATGLAAAFLWLADRAPQPFHMLELGASAGLNLNWDRFRFVYPPWRRTAGDGPLIPTDVTGGAPGWRDIAIASRAACDQNPIALSEADEVMRLRAYVWADQPERRERLDRAIELARSLSVAVEKADAAEWIAARLGSGLPQGLTVVYHSVFLQYPPRPVRDAISAAIEAAGARATSDRQLTWVRFEPEAILGGASGSSVFWLNVVRWDGRSRSESTLADVDPHGRTMAWHA